MAVNWRIRCQSFVHYSCFNIFFFKKIIKMITIPYLYSKKVSAMNLSFQKTLFFNLNRRLIFITPAYSFLWFFSGIYIIVTSTRATLIAFILCMNDFSKHSLLMSFFGSDVLLHGVRVFIVDRLYPPSPWLASF